MVVLVVLCHRMLYGIHYNHTVHSGVVVVWMWICGETPWALEVIRRGLRIVISLLFLIWMFDLQFAELLWLQLWDENEKVEEKKNPVFVICAHVTEPSEDGTCVVCYCSCATPQSLREIAPCYLPLLHVFRCWVGSVYSVCWRMLHFCCLPFSFRFRLASVHIIS